MVESFQIPLQALRRAFKKRGGRSVDQDAREKLGVPALEKFEVSLSLRRCVAVVWAALMGRGRAAYGRASQVPSRAFPCGLEGLEVVV